MNGFSKSQFLSESMVKFNLQRIESSNDTNIQSKLVRSRIENMPLSASSRARSRFTEERELYLSAFKAKYVGEVDNGMPNGYGKLYFDSGDYLEGILIDGRCEGHGRFIKANGSYYDGDLKNNVADGYGIYVDQSGYRYEGQWKNNMQNGHGESN